MGALRYVLVRFASYIITIFIALTIIFIIPRLMPIDPVTGMLSKLESIGEMYGTGDIVDSFKDRFGLDKDMGTQYLMWLGSVFRGDLGISITRYPTNVSRLILNALPWTIGLLTSVILLSWLIGNVLGAIAGWSSEHERLNWIISSISIIINRIPFYILGLLFVLVFAYYIPIFPSSGGLNPMRFYSGISLDLIIDLLYHATLPALSVIIALVGGYVITMRSLIVNIKGEDYVRFAQARGLKKSRILMRYAFRNALLPQATSLAMSLGFIFTGALIIEWIFSYPGLGSLYIRAVTEVDYNVIQGCSLFIILGVSTATLIIDLLNPLIDPRISIEKR